MLFFLPTFVAKCGETDNSIRFENWSHLFPSINLWNAYNSNVYHIIIVTNE